MQHQKTLSNQQKTNIRHFIYYLVNGTLDFSLINDRIKDPYYEVLGSNPSLFFKVCCVFINQEVAIKNDWPQVNRLAEFLCKELDPVHNSDLIDLESWELDFQIKSDDLSGEFKSFTKWFIETEIVNEVGFKDYIEEGPSLVEQCYAIWSNVIIFEEGRCSNADYTRSRVSIYIRGYYLGHEDGLEEWECNLW